jgi:seryl-tRNA(Sec) selenium transferase
VKPAVRIEVNVFAYAPGGNVDAVVRDVKAEVTRRLTGLDEFLSKVGQLTTRLTRLKEKLSIQFDTFDLTVTQTDKAATLRCKRTVDGIEVERSWLLTVEALDTDFETLITKALAFDGGHYEPLVAR